MLTRNIVLLFSLFVLLVDGDLDSNDAGIHAMPTGKDPKSNETPTDTSHSSSEIADEEESFFSEEGEKKQFISHSAKLQHNAARTIQSPAPPPQPIIPQPKAVVRSRPSKRQSRTSRRLTV